MKLSTNSASKAGSVVLRDRKNLIVDAAIGVHARTVVEIFLRGLAAGGRQG